MTRLEFLGGLGASTALATAGCRTCAPDEADSKRCGCFKLGMAGGTYWRMKDYSFLDVLAELDLHYLSVKDWHLPFTSSDAEVQAFLDRCASLKIKPYALGPVYMDTADQAKRTFDFARRLGARTIVGVPFVRRDAKGESVRFENRALAETVAHLCDEYDMRFAIHNHGPDAPELFPDAKAMYAMVKDLGPRMGFCLDIGHEYRFGGDPAAAIRQYADRIFDIHLKNVTASDKSGKAAVFSRGKINLPSVMIALRDIGFSGVCAIEWEKGGEIRSDFAGLAESVGYFRGVADMLENA